MEEKKCKHCELKILDKNMIASGFCCVGCENAYKIINEFGFKNYYDVRINQKDVRNLKPEDEIIDFENFVKEKENNVFEIFLAIDGLHCGACVWLIESILRKQENVIFARVNLTSKYLKLRFTGARKDGQKLIELISKIGYKLFPFDEKILAQKDKIYNDDLIKSLAVAGFGAGNIMLFSIAVWFYDASETGEKMRDFLHLFSSLIALPCIIYSSRIFFYSAFKAIKARRSNMDITISVAILLTCITSLVQSLRSAHHVYFDSAMMLCFFLLIGRYLDFKARKKSFDASLEFSFLNANYARILEGKTSKIIASKDVKEGMILIVSLGEKISADGILLDENCEIDNSIISGESLPKEVKKGQEIFAGAINLSSSVKILVTQNQEKSLISKIKEIIEESQNHKNKYVKIADNLSSYYTPVVHILAFLTFVFWYFFKNSGFEIAILNAISTLIITCPCALALAVPITQSLTISSLLKKAVLLKSGEALEKINKIDICIFDKTGSLTFGKPKITDFKCLNRELTKDEEEFYLKLASSISLKSKHPIAKTLANFYDKEIFDIEVFEEKGSGLKAFYQSKEAKIGKIDFVDFSNKNLIEKIDISKQKVFLSYNDDLLVFYLEDVVKDDAFEVVKKLKSIFKNIILLSGDEKNIVEKIASQLEIQDYFYEKNPIQKAEIIKDLQEKNYKIMMIGDGINDTASLSLADISISFLNGANIAQNKSDIIIQNQKLTPIFSFITIAKKSLKLIKQNLALALIYNIFAIPFAFFGFVTPLFAALAMSLSSLVVVLNSLRILKKT